ncbi:hypothetical protein B738_25185 [Photorhabdus temperata subsp. temperata M1021]|nr:hypothetical protein B738_25185 [Photorhabdus temperata subsp. temperata M1021]
MCAAKWIFANLTIQPLLPAGLPTPSAHTTRGISELSRSSFDFGFECFAVYASSPLLPPDTQDSLRSCLANLLRRVFHPQDQCSFAQRTGRTPRSVNFVTAKSCQCA